MNSFLLQTAGFARTPQSELKYCGVPSQIEKRFRSALKWSDWSFPQ